MSPGVCRNRESNHNKTESWVLGGNTTTTSQLGVETRFSHRRFGARTCPTHGILRLINSEAKNKHDTYMMLIERGWWWRSRIFKFCTVFSPCSIVSWAHSTSLRRLKPPTTSWDSPPSLATVVAAISHSSDIADTLSAMNWKPTMELRAAERWIVGGGARRRRQSMTTTRRGRRAACVCFYCDATLVVSYAYFFLFAITMT